MSNANGCDQCQELLEEALDQAGLEEELVMLHQQEVIEAAFGKEVADKANYGWGIDEVDGYIQTKVYHRSGPKILTTRIKVEFIDEWRGY